MNIYELETKIKTDNKTAMKKICSKARKTKQTKIRKKIKNLPEKFNRQKNKMSKGTYEYNDLHKVIKNKT